MCESNRLPVVIYAVADRRNQVLISQSFTETLTSPCCAFDKATIETMKRLVTERPHVVLLTLASFVVSEFASGKEPFVYTIFQTFLRRSVV